MWLAQGWRDYRLIDAGDGDRLEQWGDVILRRPDPQVIWPLDGDPAWQRADARYLRSRTGGGHWEYRRPIPEEWTVGWQELTFRSRPMGFKHTGLFPEQAANWQWMTQLVRGAGRPVEVLNLFGYTGGASVALAGAGAKVVHVDAARGMVAQAKENLQLSGLGDRPVRFIVDDAVKFVEREKRRGRRYQGILMDPPSYGRGPSGEIWKIEEQIFPLVQKCLDILAEDALFFLINGYTTGLAPSVLGNLLRLTVERRFGGATEADEVGLPIEKLRMPLPCGASGRWTAAQ